MFVFLKHPIAYTKYLSWILMQPLLYIMMFQFSTWLLPNFYCNGIMNRAAVFFSAKTWQNHFCPGNRSRRISGIIPRNMIGASNIYSKLSFLCFERKIVICSIQYGKFSLTLKFSVKPLKRTMSLACSLTEHNYLLIKQN